MLRNQSRSTFGTSARSQTPNKTEEGNFGLDTTPGYNIILKRTPTALLLGKLDGYIKNDGPG